MSYFGEYLRALNTDLAMLEIDFDDFDKDLEYIFSKVFILSYRIFNQSKQINTMQEQINEMQEQINELKKQR